MIRKKVTRKKKSRKKKDPIEVTMLRPHYGQKTGMEFLLQSFIDNAQRPPAFNTTMKESTAGASFILECHKLISKWSTKQLGTFLKEITHRPTNTKLSELLGDVKRVINELFEVEPESFTIPKPVWKMWPVKRHKAKKTKGEKRMSFAPSKKKSKKKKASKKKTAVSKKSKAATKKKKTPTTKKRKKTPAMKKRKKTASQKKSKVTKKKTGSKITDDTKLGKVKGAKAPKKADRQAIVKSIGPKGTKVSAIIEKNETNERTLKAMIRLGFLEIV